MASVDDCHCPRNIVGDLIGDMVDERCPFHGDGQNEARRVERLVLEERDRNLGTDPVNHPAHYGGDTTYEAIKVIEAWELGFCLGNAVKYIARYGKKGDGLEDLKKARWYLDREIARWEADGG